MQTLILKIGGIFLAGILLFGAGWKVCAWRTDSAYKKAYSEAVAQIQAQQDKNNELSASYQKKLAVYKEMNEKADRNVKTEIVTHTIYASCVLPASGVHLVNAAVEQANKTISSR